MKLTSLLIRPVPFFFTMQFIPLIAWWVSPNQVFDIALQGYEKAQLGYKSISVYVLMFAAFWSGCYLSKTLKFPPLLQDFSKTRRFIYFLHVSALVMAAVSTCFVFIAVFSGEVGVLDALISGSGNLLKLEVYSQNSDYQVLYMARHLILTAVITWLILKLNTGNAPRTVITMVVITILLFALTSSRLILMAAIILYILFHVGIERAPRIFSMRIIISFSALIAIFVLAVSMRSAGTWTEMTGSQNIFVAASGEFLAYYISPVNYSIAIVEQEAVFLQNVLVYSVGAFFSVFNIEVDTLHLTAIEQFYNPSLNQIGLLGQWYSGYGIFIVFPVAIYGFVSGAAYAAFRARRISGMLYYPILYISLFDSMRGFLLLQNVLAANLFFIGIIWILWRVLAAASGHAGSYRFRSNSADVG